MSKFFGLDKKEKKEDEGDKKEEEDENKKKESEDKDKDKEDKEEDADEDDKLKDGDDDDKKVEEIVLNRIEYDMSEKKKSLKLKKEDKRDMELLRRWHVKIYNIYITPMKEKCDPFVQFTLGGNYQIKVFTDKGGNTYKKAEGERGYSDKTEVIEDIDVFNKEPFDKIIDLEMRMSYAMMLSQKLMIEVWDHNSLFMNTIMGYTTIDMIDIVDGDMNQQVEIIKKEKKKKAVPICTIDFKCLFQEIWDFKLSFVNWKCSPLVQVKKSSKKQEELPKMETTLTIEIDNPVVVPPNDKAKSDKCDSVTAPVWSDFNGDIIFRGTMSALEQSNCILTLVDESSMMGHLISKKSVTLKGLLDFERIKSDFTLINPKTKDKFNCPVEGFVQIEHKIKYKQSGDCVALMSKKKYLCLRIMRVENIRPAETKGIVDSFISAEWSGQIQRTKTIKENNNPTFNEVVYFEVPFPEEWLAEPSKYIQKLNDEFSSKNEVVFNLMIEGDDNTYDNLGIGTFHLSDIKNASEKTQRKYFAEDLKTDKTYGTRLYVGRSKLISAFSISNSTYVNFEAWFLDDFPDLIDFGEKKKASEKEDKIPVEMLPYFKRSKTYFLDKYNEMVKSKMSANNSKNYKDRCFQDKYLYVSDQYKMMHYLPYFLSIITPPEIIYSKEDMVSNRNFHDANIRTLDEVNHYVHCFPYSSDSNEGVMVSPDFLLKIRKGDISDHCILAACLMMGLLENNTPPIMRDDLQKQAKAEEEALEKKGGGDTTKGEGLVKELDKEDEDTKKGGHFTTKDPTKGAQATAKTEENHPYENRVFVCIGKLKTYNTPHKWIMTISDDYKDILFWDPQYGLKYTLEGRVEDADKMRKFLSGKYADYDACDRNEVTVVKKIEVIEEKEEKHEEDPDSDDSDANIKQGNKKNYDDRKIPGHNESFENNNIAYNKFEDEGNKDDILQEDNLIGNNFEYATHAITKKNKETIKEFYDDRILSYKDTAGGGQKKTTFLEESNKAITGKLQASKNTFTPVDEFKNKYGKLVDMEALNMPFDTLDMIFNRNNILINMGYHDPKCLQFNLYEKDYWVPFFDLQDDIMSEKVDKIWTGQFDMFYSLTNFGPVIKPKIVNKMKEQLMKEMRVGITAARSGMNLQTKFKKKNENINEILGRYCVYSEELALNRITQRHFNEKIDEWEIMIKQKLPKYFKMEAVQIFFNFFELEIIRRLITEDLENYYKTKEKNLMFAVSAGVFPYLNGIVSVRIILAKFYKISEEELTGEELKDYREGMLTAHLLPEEEGSDEEVEETPEGEETPGDNDVTKSGDTPTTKGEATIGGKTNIVVENKGETKGETTKGETKGNTPKDEKEANRA